MAPQLAAGFIATALVAGSAGWLIRGPATLAAATPVATKAPLAAAASSGQAQAGSADPLIAVSSDGNVTLRVEQQPLEWVLDQIALQTGWAASRERARAAPMTGAVLDVAPAPGCPETPVASPAETARLLQAIQRGSEAERFDGLLQARGQGTTLPDESLKLLYETDASDRVRLLAFENYLEPLSGDGPALRSTLEAALNVPNAAVQREARARLDELAESERIDRASPQK